MPGNFRNLGFVSCNYYVYLRKYSYRVYFSKTGAADPVDALGQVIRKTKPLTPSADLFGAGLSGIDITQNLNH